MDIRRRIGTPRRGRARRRRYARFSSSSSHDALVDSSDYDDTGSATTPPSAARTGGVTDNAMLSQRSKRAAANKSSPLWLDHMCTGANTGFRTNMPSDSFIRNVDHIFAAGAFNAVPAYTIPSINVPVHKLKNKDLQQEGYNVAHTDIKVLMHIIYSSSSHTDSTHYHEEEDGYRGPLPTRRADFLYALHCMLAVSRYCNEQQTTATTTATNNKTPSETPLLFKVPSILNVLCEVSSKAIYKIIKLNKSHSSASNTAGTSSNTAGTSSNTAGTSSSAGGVPEKHWNSAIDYEVEVLSACIAVIESVMSEESSRVAILNSIGTLPYICTSAASTNSIPRKCAYNGKLTQNKELLLPLSSKSNINSHRQSPVTDTLTLPFGDAPHKSFRRLHLEKMLNSVPAVSHTTHTGNDNSLCPKTGTQSRCEKGSMESGDGTTGTPTGMDNCVARDGTSDDCSPVIRATAVLSAARSLLMEEDEHEAVGRAAGDAAMQEAQARDSSSTGTAAKRDSTGSQALMVSSPTASAQRAYKYFETKLSPHATTSL